MKPDQRCSLLDAYRRLARPRGSHGRNRPLRTTYHAYTMITIGPRAEHHPLRFHGPGVREEDPRGIRGPREVISVGRFVGRLG